MKKKKIHYVWIVEHYEISKEKDGHDESYVIKAFSSLKKAMAYMEEFENKDYVYDSSKSNKYFKLWIHLRSKVDPMYSWVYYTTIYRVEINN